MQYVIADIHGCYREYIELLEKIGFADEDDLYLLGDLMDRGPEPIRVLQDVMCRPNVIPILGNHDYMAWSVLSRFAVEITERNVSTQLTASDMTNYLHWTQDGGSVTAQQFRKLDADERMDMLDFLSGFSVYEEVFADGKRFVLTHGDIHRFNEERELDEYDVSDFIFHRADYDRRYFRDSNTFLVTGHTPTMLIRSDGQSLVVRQNGHIALDCGCVFGGKLAAYCLETGDVTYVDAKQSCYG